MKFKTEEIARIREALAALTRILLELASGGLEEFPAARIKELRSLSRGLTKLRQRRIASRVQDLANYLGTRQPGESSGELSTLVSDCLQTIKFVKAYLKEPGKVQSREVLDEVFLARWSDSEVEVLQKVDLIEVAVESLSLAKTHRVDVRYLLSLADGRIFMTKQEMLYPASEDTLRPRPMERMLHLKKGQVFPGYPPREIRLLEFTEGDQVAGDPVYRQAVELSIPTVAGVRETFQELHGNYFAPPAIPLFVRVPGLVTRGLELHIADGQGQLIRIDRTAGPLTTRFFRMAAGARILALFGRAFVDDLGFLSLAPLSAVVVRKDTGLVNFG